MVGANVNTVWTTLLVQSQPGIQSKIQLKTKTKNQDYVWQYGNEHICFSRNEPKPGGSDT